MKNIILTSALALAMLVTFAQEAPKKAEVKKTEKTEVKKTADLKAKSEKKAVKTEVKKVEVKPASTATPAAK